MSRFWRQTQTFMRTLSDSYLAVCRTHTQTHTHTHTHTHAHTHTRTQQAHMCGDRRRIVPGTHSTTHTTTHTHIYTHTHTHTHTHTVFGLERATLINDSPLVLFKRHSITGFQNQLLWQETHIQIRICKHTHRHGHTHTHTHTQA